MKKLELAAAILFMALPCAAQTQDPAPAPAPANGTQNTTQTPAPTTAKKKPKKVWTNDDVSSVKGGVSVVGDGDKGSDTNGGPKPESGGAAQNGNDETRKRQIESYRSQRQQLQAEIDAADKKIDQLRNFKGENTSPSGGINMNQGYNMVPVEDQVKQLEEKKKQLQGKIEDLEVDAKKNGIEPGEIR